jgi:diaminopimelate epimerase
MRLSKLHGLGNDFLVLLDDGASGPVAAERARALCGRRTGVGADGLIRSERRGGQAITFELVNADGTSAEMSGNGARCLGLAAARAGWWDDRDQPLVLGTVVGDRQLDWVGGDLAEATLGVAMGEVVPEGDPTTDGTGLGGSRAGDSWTTWALRVGNPHQVALIDGPMPPAEELAEALSLHGSNDSNFEFVVRGPDVGALTLVVHERGAGWTQACGTGSVAAAWAAHQQGWVGRLVTVHNPGGPVQVDLSGPEARLLGPAAFVAAVEVADEAVREEVAP